MQAYPDWKLMYRLGNDVYYVYLVQAGDPDYVAFWDRVENEPKEASFGSVDEGMQKVLNGFYVAQMQEGSIRGWIREHPLAGDKVKIFGNGNKQFYTLILTNNSPMGPIFQFACREMIEKGVKERISTQWIGRKAVTQVADLESTLIVLKPGQVIMIYFLMFLTIVTTLSVFCLEHIAKLITSRMLQMKDDNDRPLFQKRVISAKLVANYNR